jgi:hypothetical protein
VTWRRWFPLAGVIVLVWLALAYCAGPPDAHGYRRTAVTSAQSALSAVRTVILAGRTPDRLLDPYTSTVFDDAVGSVASAQQQLSAQAAPDADTRRVRDQLLPLLTEAGREIADLSQALSDGDAHAAQGHLDRLTDLGNRLDDFVARYR